MKTTHFFPVKSIVLDYGLGMEKFLWIPDLLLPVLQQAQYINIPIKQAMPLSQYIQ